MTMAETIPQADLASEAESARFRALTAEVVMLRQHAARGRRRPAAPRPRQPWRTIDGYWWGGRAAGMQDLVDLASEVAGTAATAGPVLAAVLDMAIGVIELQDIEEPPSAWSGEAGQR
jgi:hypothetical protein